MARRLFYTSLFLLACLATLSCKKLESTNPNLAGPLAKVPTQFADAIPDEFGTLVGVTQNPKSPGWISLWFQKPDRTITAVFVNIDEGRIYDKTLTIPRK